MRALGFTNTLFLCLKLETPSNISQIETQFPSILGEIQQQVFLGQEIERLKSSISGDQQAETREFSSHFLRFISKQTNRPLRIKIFFTLQSAFRRTIFSIPKMFHFQGKQTRGAKVAHLGIRLSKACVPAL